MSLELQYHLGAMLGFCPANFVWMEDSFIEGDRFELFICKYFLVYCSVIS